MVLSSIVKYQHTHKKRLLASRMIWLAVRGRQNGEAVASSGHLCLPESCTYAGQEHEHATTWPLEPLRPCTLLSCRDGQVLSEDVSGACPPPPPDSAGCTASLVPYRCCPTYDCIDGKASRVAPSLPCGIFRARLKNPGFFINTQWVEGSLLFVFSVMF